MFKSFDLQRRKPWRCLGLVSKASFLDQKLQMFIVYERFTIQFIEVQSGAEIRLK